MLFLTENKQNEQLLKILQMRCGTQHFGNIASILRKKKNGIEMQLETWSVFSVTG